MNACRPLICLIVTFVVSFVGVRVGAEDAQARLHVEGNGRFLATPSGQPAFLLCDTAWSLATRVSREDAEIYLKKRREQKFNAVTFVLFPCNSKGLADTVKNLSGQAPFKIVAGLADPAQPDVKPGAKNDYWDHVDWLITLTRQMGFQAVILPVWGSAVVGGYDGKNRGNNVFNASNAYAYGRWLGERYHDQPHVIWMLGGDRRAVYGKQDYRPVFRAMAEGIGDGVHASNGSDGHTDFSDILMSFHSQKKSPQSSDWFHHDKWLSFNSIQNWPENQVASIDRDWHLTPPKPTWVFEPRYEGYWREPYTAADWGEWQIRQQAWQSVLAGGFGFTYGHERIFGFGEDGWDWKRELEAPGADQMQNLVKIFAMWSPEDYFSRIADPSLLEGDAGQAGRLKSNRVTVTRNAAGTLAMFYSADGSNIPVRMDRLSDKTMTASWFNPRTGNWRVGDAEFAQPKASIKDLNGGPGEMIRVFVPPGGRADGNDWLLVLDQR